MRLTGAGKFLLFVVGLGVLGYAGWTYRSQLPVQIPGTTSTSTAPPATPTPAPAPAPAADRKGVLGNVRQTGVLRVGMEPDAPPLHFINDRKQEDGFDFRLAGIIAEGLGAKRIQVVEADYEDLPDRLRAGDIDVIMAGYVPDPSIEGVVWSNGYLDFGLCMIVQRGHGRRPTGRVQGSRRQAHRDLRRPGGRALGAAEHPERADQQVLGRRRLVRGGREGSGRRAHLRLPVRGRRDQSASADGHRPVQPQPVEVRGRHPGWQLRSGLRGQRARSTSSRRRRSTPT